MRASSNPARDSDCVRAWLHDVAADRATLHPDIDIGPDGRFVMVERELASSVPREPVGLAVWTAADPARVASR